MRKHAFKIGLVFYALLWMVLTAGLWYGLWHYADAYELAQPKGAMNAYMEERLRDEMEAQVAAYSASAANDYQSQEEISAFLTETLLDKEWSYRRSRESTTDAPVYTLYSGDKAVCKVNLVAGEAGALSFGQKPWEVQPADAGLDKLARTLTIVAPAGSGVTLNGKAVKEAAVPMTWYPEFEENAADMKELLTLEAYEVPGISLEKVEVAVQGDFDVISPKENTWYVVPRADEAAKTEMDTFAKEFANEYLMFTSNAGSYYTLIRYVAPAGALQDRLHRSLDGMGWVHYTTGKLEQLNISNLQYYGNTFTYDAAYDLKLKSGDMAGNMHVVVVRTELGWRASSVELF